VRATTSHESRHLSAADLLDSTAACPICLDRGARRSVFRVQTGPDVFLLRCGRCQGCSASHMPRPEYLRAYYGSYYQGRDEKVTFSGKERFAAHLLRAIPAPWAREHTRMLDFGGGDGTLAIAVAVRLLERFPRGLVDITVVDQETPAPSPDARIRIEQRSCLEETDGFHDLVLASAVLEHIPDLHPILLGLVDRIGQGGLFYARTPYALPLARILPALDLTYPAHVHDLGSGFWNGFADLFGLRARYLASRPSLVASSWREEPLRALVAHSLKLPASLEAALSPPSRKHRLWRLVGGWEVLLQNGG
jgi:methyltransferase family protein